MKILKKHLAVATLGLGLMTVGAAQAELAIVVNPAYSGNSISTAEVRNLFQGKSNKLPNGVRAKMVDLPSGNAARAEFLSEVLHQSESELNRYWSRLIFSGKGRPPEVLDSADAVKRWVALNPEGIAYINSKDVDRSVKVVLRVR